MSVISWSLANPRHVGKNKWQPIEHGLIEWKPGMSQNDPAGDLVNVTLTLPTPPPTAFPQQVRPYIPNRQIKAMPSRARLTSGVPQSARITSVTMGEPDHYASVSAPMMGYGYSQNTAPPMYGEDQVAMTVQMPPVSAHTSPLPTVQQGISFPTTVAPSNVAWNGDSGVVKCSRSEEAEEGDKAEELDFEREVPTLWQE